MKIEYNGHIMEFKEENLKSYEKHMHNKLEDAIPIYVEQELGEREAAATTAEIRAAIVTCAKDEMSFYGYVFEE
jgi:hypothetical protein